MPRQATQAEIDAILSSRRIAFLGASRKPTGFGRYAYKTLRRKGLPVVPINPNAEEIAGERCYPSVSELPEPADAAIIMLKPQRTVHVLEEIADAGIARVWIQQGSGSPEALAFCRDRDIACVSGHCILMFADPVRGIHRLHRGWRKWRGMLPE